MTNNNNKPIITDDIETKVQSMDYDELLNYHGEIQQRLSFDKDKLKRLQFIEGFKSFSATSLINMGYTEEQIKSFYPVSKQVLDSAKTQETGTAQFKTVTKYHFNEPKPEIDYTEYIRIELPDLYNEFESMCNELDDMVEEMEEEPSFELHKEIMQLSKEINSFIKDNVPPHIKKEYRMLKKDMREEQKFLRIAKLGKIEFSIKLNELKLKFIESEQLAKRPKRVESDYQHKLNWYMERYQ